ncbi:NAD(P)-binding protein [Pluteus cervinus]|uniref:NAD(P)-binding protein n=1 Tax=Pluteus cervinus TaxID=181527 RepID=A0ACD3AAR3_9AGAR|nr:NAD(P)-binding protein [Pluteus cervinus]
MSKGLVLVTGTNGYLGSHIVDLLLKEGWAVRAISRPGRSQAVKDTFITAGDKLQTIEVQDIVDGDLSEAVKGVDAIIHTVTPGFGDSPADMLHVNIDGTLNLFKAGIAAGVKKLIYTSSIVALFNADWAAAYKTDLIDETFWPDITREQFDPINTSLTVAYMHSKTLAEKAFWELADEHKDVDFSALLPPLIFGARPPNAPKPTSRPGLSTATFIYHLIDRENTYPPEPVGSYVHVKDIAKAHVAALSVGPLPDGRRKRFIVAAPKSFTWSEASEIIRSERPELAARTVPKGTELLTQTSAPFDTSLAAKYLGLEEYIGFKETLLDTVDYLVEWEKK